MTMNTTRVAEMLVEFESDATKVALNHDQRLEALEDALKSRHEWEALVDTRLDVLETPTFVDESIEDFARWMSQWLVREGYTWYTPGRLVDAYIKSRRDTDAQSG